MVCVVRHCLLKNINEYIASNISIFFSVALKDVAAVQKDWSAPPAP